MNMPTVAITQPRLPAVLPTDTQGLMDVFHGFWQTLSAQVAANNKAIDDRCCDVFVVAGAPGMMRGPTQAEIAAVMPAKVNAAVMLGNMNYQIGNGGLSQYLDNGYATAVPQLIAMFEAANALGVRDAGHVANILTEFAKRRDAQDARPSYERGYFASNDEDQFGIYSDLDDRYYEIDGERVMQDLLDRFERVMDMCFVRAMPSDDRLAA